MTDPVKRQHLIGLAVILLLGALLRFSNLDSSEFWYDEATLSTLAQNMAAGKALPLLGIISSAHIPNPPTGAYLLAIPYWFSKNPLVAVGFIAFLNVIGIALLWLLAYRYFGSVVAFVSGLFYAVSPWAVIYSRKIWGQDMHTPLLLVGFLLGLYGFVEGKRWAQILCLPVLVFAMQIHFAAWVLLPAYVWLLWMGRKRLSRTAVAISIILALLTLVPYAIGIAQTHTASGAGSLSISLTLLPLQQIAELATGQGMGERFVFPPGVELVSQVPVIGVIWLVMIPLMALGLWAIWRKSSHEYAVFLALWAFLTPLLLVTGLYMSHPHYFIPCIPIYCLLAGAGAAWLVRERPLPARLGAGVAALVALIAVTQIADWRSFLAYADTTYVEVPGFMNIAYATPLHDYLDIRANVSTDVMMIAGSIHQALPDLWSPLLYGQVQCLRELVITDGGIAVLPDHPFSLLRAPNATPYEFAAMFKSSKQMVFPLRVGEGSYTLDQIEVKPVWNGPALTAIDPTRFDNGVTLQGYAFANQRLYLDWTLPAASPNDYQYFAHLLNANGDKAAQHDASFYPGKFWCANDRIITWINLDRPPESVKLIIGMYRLENGRIKGDNTVDSAGNVVAPWVEIPLTAN